MTRRTLPLPLLATLVASLAACESPTRPSHSDAAVTTPSSAVHEVTASAPYHDSVAVVDAPPASAVAGCDWRKAAAAQYACAKGGNLVTYVGCALASWANFCSDLDFTDFLEGVGSEGGGLGGGGGGAY